MTAPKMVRLTVLVPEPLAEKVERLADANERTIPGELRLALKAHLGESEKAA